MSFITVLTSKQYRKYKWYTFLKDLLQIYALLAAGLTVFYITGAFFLWNLYWGMPYLKGFYAFVRFISIFGVVLAVLFNKDSHKDEQVRK